MQSFDFNYFTESTMKKDKQKIKQIHRNPLFQILHRKKGGVHNRSRKYIRQQARLSILQTLKNELYE